MCWRIWIMEDTMQLTRANGTPHEYCVIPHQGELQCCMSSTVIIPSRPNKSKQEHWLSQYWFMKGLESVILNPRRNARMMELFDETLFSWVVVHSYCWWILFYNCRNFSAMGLSGTLSSDIGVFTSATFLSLSNNSLQGTLPDALGNLVNLRTL